VQRRTFEQLNGSSAESEKPDKFMSIWMRVFVHFELRELLTTRQGFSLGTDPAMD
jgi:hypothetical protein